MEPASIRFSNPGAMWGKGNAIATKYGATASPILNDGLGQGNNIAVFPDKVHGAAAQFDLWNSHYTGMTLKAAITKWSGGNWSQSYANFLIKSGIALTTIITSAILSSSSGLELLKLQAQWEAGQLYPMTDDEWKQAQDMVFKNVTIATSVIPTNTLPLLIVGSSGVNVSKLQKLLGCKDTGTYQANSETEFALKLFQIRHSLTPDGQCGQLTWEKLNSKIEW